MKQSSGKDNGTIVGGSKPDEAQALSRVCERTMFLIGGARGRSSPVVPEAGIM